MQLPAGSENVICSVRGHRCHWHHAAYAEVVEPGKATLSCMCPYSLQALSSMLMTLDLMQALQKAEEETAREKASAALQATR